VAALGALGLGQQPIDRVDLRGEVGRYREGDAAGIAGGDQACSRMKARICGQMISRQRRPLKMP
jgi:hypothetical protein